MRIQLVAIGAALSGCLGVDAGPYSTPSDTEAPDVPGLFRGEWIAVEDPPPYPAGPYGHEVGDVVADFSLPGGAPDEEIEDEIGLGDFWLMAHRAENPRTVLMIDVHGN